MNFAHQLARIVDRHAVWALAVFASTTLAFGLVWSLGALVHTVA